MIEYRVFCNCSTICEINKQLKALCSNGHIIYLVLYFRSEFSNRSIWLPKSTVFTSAVILSPRSLISWFMFSIDWKNEKHFLKSWKTFENHFGYSFIVSMCRIIDFRNAFHIGLQHESCNNKPPFHLKPEKNPQNHKPLVVVNERDRSAKPPVKLAGRENEKLSTISCSCNSLLIGMYTRNPCSRCTVCSKFKNGLYVSLLHTAYELYLASIWLLRVIFDAAMSWVMFPRSDENTVDWMITPADVPNTVGIEY